MNKSSSVITLSKLHLYSLFFIPKVVTSVLWIALFFGMISYKRLCLSSKEILKVFAANGLGVAFMPAMAVTTEITEKKLKKVAWAGADFPVYSQIFVHKGKHQNRAIEELIGLITNQ